MSKDELVFDPNDCAHCGAEKVMTDVLGFAWCEEHRIRGDVLNKGPQLNWCSLKCAPYALLSGQMYWAYMITHGCEDLSWLAMAAIECLESEVA